ncbi:MAG TPA: glycosyl transferase family 1, partial [Brevundimonas sp.]|nr:glycosyl transferase family 1 [Brevundimonas sp.]
HAAGAALISSGRGGLREASGTHAVYVDPPEAAPLTCALLSLTRDDARRIALAREGQAFVAQTHAPALRAAELDALRLSLTESPSPAMRPVFVGQGRRQSLTEARR